MKLIDCKTKKNLSLVYQAGYTDGAEKQLKADRKFMSDLIKRELRGNVVEECETKTQEEVEIATAVAEAEAYQKYLADKE